MDMSDLIEVLDDHGFADTAEARKVETLNDTYFDVCSRDPWPFLEASASVSLTAGDDTPTLPTDFRAALVFIIPARAIVLQPERLDTIAKNRAGVITQQGLPYYYYFVGSELRIAPVPDTSDTATLFYLKNPTELTAASAESAILIPPRHHRVLALGAISRLYAMEDDPELSALFGQQFENRIATMRNDTWQRQFDRPDRVIDVGEDFWG
jgi:hypothetical protein